ncbi:MAG: amidohydrolase family protein, partial [Bacteroidia bacterium]|nr:amidohydrolase family protein [Bacteroidia bacterium]
QETNVAGGLVAQDAKGPTGLLIDGAMELVKRMMPAPTEAEIERRLLHAQTILLRHGITAFTDALLTNIEYERLCRLAEEGKWHIRIFGYLPADEQHLSQWLHKQPSQEGKIRICGFKAFADGALGSRGAWLLAPYEDAATTGLDLLSSSGFDDLVKRLAATPWQLMVHAIGDAANEYVLETFFQHRHLIQPEARWRLEHAQMLTPKSWELLRQLPVIPSIQPTHATSDKEWVTDRIGKDRLQYAYPLGSLVRAGFPVPLGTDVPVESPSPLDTLFSAVTRRSRQLPKFSPILLSEQMPPEEAMMGMTLWPAYAVKAEKYLGSLSDTIFADFFAIDHNLLTVSEEGMCEAQVLMTVIDGKIIFS